MLQMLKENEMTAIEIVTDNAAQRLGQLAAQADCVRAAVAYWTLQPQHFDPAFVQALGHPNGFLCVDIHYPTSVDVIDEYKADGANVFLYLYELTGKSEGDSVAWVRSHLLHSKVFLFDCKNDQAFAWIGSHNGTFRALNDINIECSVVLTLNKGSAEYNEIEYHLEAVRRASTAFHRDDLGYYKLLQGEAEGESTVEVEDADPNDLKTGSSITIFGCDDGDFKGLRKVGDGVILAVSRTSTGTETFYKVSIDQSGNMDGRSRITFSSRRFAMRETTSLPELRPFGDVPEHIYKRARYFVTLTITNRLPSNTRGLEVARSDAAWEIVSTEEYQRRIEDGNGLPSKLFSATNKPLKIKQPASKEKLLSQMVMNLEDRKMLSKHTLIRKRIIVQD